jgi:hypothetical protein
MWPCGSKRLNFAFSSIISCSDRRKWKDSCYVRLVQRIIHEPRYSIIVGRSKEFGLLFGWIFWLQATNFDCTWKTYMEKHMTALLRQECVSMEIWEDMGSSAGIWCKRLLVGRRNTCLNRALRKGCIHYNTLRADSLHESCWFSLRPTWSGRLTALLFMLWLSKN